MLKFILKRILESVPVMFIVITATFFLVRMAPGGPFDSEKNVPAEIMKNLNERYHLNDPLHVQYLDYLKNILLFDFGPSFKFPGRTVTEMIFTGLPVTFELGVYALIVAVIIGITPGVIAAMRPNSRTDYVPMAIAMFGICVPSFLLGPLLVLIFAVGLEILPVSGWDGPMSKILPAITLGSVYAAYLARLSRGGMLEVLSQDYIRTARAKGVPERKVIIKHALRGGLIPAISYLGPAMAGLLSGSFVVETIFRIPGLGRFYVQAAFNRDYTMIMGTTVLLGVLIVLFNMLSDIIQVWMNPRLSYK